MVKVINPDGDDFEIISIAKLDAEYRIRLKINGKYYVGHLEMSE